MDSSTQQKMTLVACRLMVICIWITTLSRPLVVDLNVVFTVIGIVESVIITLLYLTVRAEQMGRFAPIIVSLSIPIAALPLMLISGGVHSPYAFMLPVFPFFTTLILGARLSIYATAGFGCIVLAMGVFSNNIVDLIQAEHTVESTISRTYWLLAALGGAVTFSTFFDSITKALSSTLRDEANLDYLTRVSNRRGLEQILEREEGNAQRHDSWLGIIFLDIDNFKLFNDKFGHVAGDRRLKYVAQTLGSASRSKQDFVGRWGGEEFLVVLPDTNSEETKKIAEQIRREIEFSEIGGQKETHRITATLGCCSVKGASVNINSMLHAADRALYKGKSRGKNQVVMAAMRQQSKINEAG